MATSSARPLNLLEYTIDTSPHHDAMPATAEVDRLVQQVSVGGAEWLDRCYAPPGAGIEAVRNAAKELDTWVGVVGAGFVKADGGDVDRVVTLDDARVIEHLPPLLADPPAEVREKVAEGQALYDRLAQACADRDHDEIQAILDEVQRRGDAGEEALIAGFGSRIGVDGQDDFEQMLEDGMRPKDRPGFWGGVVDVLAGAWDAVWGTVTFLWDHSTIRMLVDPDGYFEDTRALAEAVWAGIQDPGAFLEALVDIDGLRDNPERWFGQFAPDVVLAILTAGTGTAATRGTSVVTKLDELADLTRTLHVLDDIDVATDTTHALRRLLLDFDGDIARTRDALRRHLTDEVGLDDDLARVTADRIAGNEFNRTQRGQGSQLSEIELGASGTRGPRVDAWDPVRGEIISRKFTQLGEVAPSTARSYITELANKYAAGQPVKITPTVIRKAEVAGLDPADLPATLRGRPVLEVPPQSGPLRPDLLTFARDQGVMIRQTDGTVLSP